MQSQPLASNNPGRESRAIRDAEEFGALCDALRLPDADRSRFKAWVLACTNPRGLRFYMSREVKVGAVAAGCCETTMRKTVRKLERLGLVHEQPDTNLRTKKHWVDVERLRRQNWKTGLCGRCNHKHGPDGECGHPLEARKWHRRREEQPRMVKRTCRCAPREILPPKKYGPQSVPSQAPPEASPPVQPAARPQPSPAAPARDETFRKFGSRAAREARKLRVALFRYVADNMRIPRDRYGHDLSPGDEGYRLPMPRDQAIREACVDLALTEPEGRELLKFGEEFLGPEKEE